MGVMRKFRHGVPAGIETWVLFSQSKKATRDGKAVIVRHA